MCREPTVVVDDVARHDANARDKIRREPAGNPERDNAAAAARDRLGQARSDNGAAAADGGDAEARSDTRLESETGDNDDGLKLRERHHIPNLVLRPADKFL